MESFKQLLLTVRDFLIPYLPKFAIKLLVGKGDFVFMAHAIDLSDFSKKYPFASGMPKDNLKIFSRFLWTIIGSKITGFKLKDGTSADGWIIFCPLSTRTMILKKEMAKRKIVKAARFAEKLDVKILGLGAFIPILAEDGFLLKDKVSMAITTGSSFSAIIAINNILRASTRVEIETKNATLAIVGAAGSVGSVCAGILAEYFGQLILVDKNIAAVTKMCEHSLKEHFIGKSIAVTDKIEEIRKADVVLAVTNVPGVIVRSAYLKPGTVVVDAAQPKNVSKKVPEERKDVLVVESGIAEVENVKVNFDLGLRKENEVYSCLAEAMLLLWLGKVETHLGITDIAYAKELWGSAESAGIRLADFRNSTGFVTQQTIDEVKKARQNTDTRNSASAFNHPSPFLE